MSTRLDSRGCLLQVCNSTSEAPIVNKSKPQALQLPTQKTYMEQHKPRMPTLLGPEHRPTKRRETGPYTITKAPSSGSISDRVQAPNISGLWSQNHTLNGLLEPESMKYLVLGPSGCWFGGSLNACPTALTLASPRVSCELILEGFLAGRLRTHAIVA